MGKQMSITLQWICGCTFGIEITEALVEEQPIGYCLIDFGIVRVQLAWFIEN
jgi:hypothetical protein